MTAPDPASLDAMTVLRRERDAALALAAEVIGEFKQAPSGHSAGSVIAVVLPGRHAGWAGRAEAIAGQAEPDGAALAASGAGDGGADAPAGVLGASERDPLTAGLGELLELVRLPGSPCDGAPHEVLARCLPEVARIVGWLAGYENAAAQDTACVSCAAERERAERAEAALAAERERILAVAERLKEPHTGPGSNGEGYAVPLSLLRAGLAPEAVPDSPCYQPDCAWGAEWATVRPSAEGGEAS